jgi:D-apionolactonase
MSHHELRVGRRTPPLDLRELHAGPVTACLYGGDLRYARIGDTVLVQRIYVALRDEVWNTIPGELSNLDIEEGDQSFRVEFDSRHRYREIDFAWQGTIEGRPDGSISYAMRGRPATEFRYAKIGINLHHPLRESRGRPYRARGPQGELRGTLPVEIEPQLVIDGTFTALFPPYDALTIEYENGLEVRFDFEGDLFEMQDHRNWTDANFKTYGTPQSIPGPFDAQVGREIAQQVTMSFDGKLPQSTRRRKGLDVAIGDSLGARLPAIGFCTAGHGDELSAREVELLRRLAPDHVRVDLRLGSPDVEDALVRAGAVATALRAGLELAVFANDEADLDGLAGILRAQRPAVSRVLVLSGGPGFSASSGTTTPGSLMRAARERLSQVLPGVPLVGGTNQFFTELNRIRPEIEKMDGIVYSINPQVHAADDLSLVENLEAQGETVQMAHRWWPGLPVMISPVTLIGRAGPYPAGPPEPDGLPGNVDVRLASLFGAGWTAGSIKQLSEAGAAAVTYYETTGWLGLIEREEGSPRPDRFPSRPGGAFPLYHVFADLAEWKRGHLLACRTAAEPEVQGLAVLFGGARRVLVANLTARDQQLRIGPFAGGHARLRLLDETTGEGAIDDPTAFRAAAERVPVGSRNTLTLELGPFALARIDDEAA